MNARRAARLALWPAAVVAGLAAEAAGYGWDRPADWLPDLITGWALIACGAAAARHGEGARRDHGAGAARHGEGARRIGLLLVASGFAWFAGTAFAGAAYWHRGPLLHAALTFPRGRATGRVQRAVPWGFTQVPLMSLQEKSDFLSPLHTSTASPLQPELRVSQG